MPDGSQEKVDRTEINSCGSTNMRDSTASFLRASIIAAAAVTLTALSSMPFESSYSASSQRTQPRAEATRSNAPGAVYHVRGA
jgi:hypothetical protein